MNVENLHIALENRNVDTLYPLFTDRFIKELDETGGITKYFKYIPKTPYPGTRNILETVQTQNRKISIVENVYVDDQSLITLKDLMWESKINNQWKIDMFYILEVIVDELGPVS